MMALRSRWRRLPLVVVAVVLGVVAAVLPASVSATVSAATPPPTPPAPTPVPPTVPSPTDGDARASLIPVPVGCPAPDPAAVVFTGVMVGKDDITQTVRFEIDQVRAGSATPWAAAGMIDIRYGADYRFLDQGELYLVGAGIDPRYNVLASTVRPPQPTFGGNDVVGVDDLAVDCPELDDPIRTLEVDGTAVESGVLSLMTRDRRLLLATIMVPAGIVVLVLLAMVLVRTFGSAALRSVVGLSRAALTPVTDHRATRVRSHRLREQHDWSASSNAPGDAELAGHEGARPTPQA